MVCPRCKSQLPAGATSCPKCGARFSQGKRCPYCQSVIPASATACPKCGRPQPQGTAGAASQRAPSQGGKSGGFRWWYILIGVGIFGLGAAVGAIGMRQYIASQVQSAFNQVSDSLKDFANFGQESDSAAGDEGSAPEAPEEGDTSGKYYFADNVLVTEDVRIEITDWKVIPVGEAGNEYGDAPVIAFWYSTTNLTGNENVTPISSWIAMFTAVQDNNPDMVNELQVASLPDRAFLDTQSATIKKDGTVDCACAYTLSDTTTPVTLKATRGLLGENLGEQTYNISE